MRRFVDKRYHILRRACVKAIIKRTFAVFNWIIWIKKSMRLSLTAKTIAKNSVRIRQLFNLVLRKDSMVVDNGVALLTQVDIALLTVEMSLMGFASFTVLLAVLFLASTTVLGISQTNEAIVLIIDSSFSDFI
jgi:hypothetical protein